MVAKSLGLLIPGASCFGSNPILPKSNDFHAGYMAKAASSTVAGPHLTLGRGEGYLAEAETVKMCENRAKNININEF